MQLSSLADHTLVHPVPLVGLSTLKFFDEGAGGKWIFTFDCHVANAASLSMNIFPSRYLFTLAVYQSKANQSQIHSFGMRLSLNL